MANQLGMYIRLCLVYFLKYNREKISCTQKWLNNMFSLEWSRFWSTGCLIRLDTSCYIRGRSKTTGTRRGAWGSGEGVSRKFTHGNVTMGRYLIPQLSTRKDLSLYGRFKLPQLTHESFLPYTVVKWRHTEGIEREKTSSQNSQGIALNFWTLFSLSNLRAE